MADDIKKLIRESRKEGWVTKPTKGNHLRMQHISGALVFVSNSASDHRALDNIRADMKRALIKGNGHGNL